jgi:type I restriction enzyme S subunit
MFGTVKNSKWKNEKLENITEKITDGKHGGCKSQENSGYYFIGATEIYNDKINYEHSNQITKKDFEKDYTRCDLQLEDFVIVNTGATIGKNAIVVDKRCENTLLQKSVALIRVNKKKILPIYLKYCYEEESSLYSKGQGCARINLLLSQIRNTDIPIPPIELQNRFADIVKQIDKQKFESVIELREIQKNIFYKWGR